MRALSRADYELRLANVQHLFPLSSAAYEVFLLSNREETAPRTLVSTMLQDAALTADVLRLANSAYYSRNRPATIDVEEAVVRIGYRKVGEIALALNAMGAFRGCIVPWLDAELGQARSLAASVALARLCETRDWRSGHDGMALSAFLHPLGRLVLGSAFQDEYKSIIRLSLEHSEALGKLESRVFPESHFAALARVLSRWKVPEEVWAPLYQLGESYETVARLAEPLRSRVEVIKMAIFIGELAVGRWMPWDQIEPPPAHVRARHSLFDLDAQIEQTRKDIEQVADRHKSFNKQMMQASRSMDGDRPESQVLYCNPSGSKDAWMPYILRSLGIDTCEMTAGGGRTSGWLVVDCLDAKANDVARAIGRSDWKPLKPLLMIPQRARAELEQYGATLCFPASVASIRTAVELAAQPLSPLA